MQRAFFLTIGVVWSIALQAQPTPPTLAELLEQSMRVNHKLEVEKQEIALSRYDHQQLRESHLPVAQLNGKYGFLTQNMHAVTDPATLYLPSGTHHLPALDNGLQGSANLLHSSLEVHSLLYSGGKIPAMKKALDEKIKAQETFMERSQQQITEEVLRAYDQLLLLDQVKKVIDESQRRLDVHTKTAQRALQYGLITPYELKKLEVAQGQLRHKLIHFEGQRWLVIQQLSMLSNISADRIQLINGSLEEAMVPTEPITAEDRPELRALMHAIQAEKHHVSALKTWWKPKVVASVSLGYYHLFDAKVQGKTPLPHDLGYNSLVTQSLRVAPDFRVGVGFKWDVFDGLKGKREVQKALTRTRIAELKYAESVEWIDLELYKAQTDLATAQAEVSSQKSQLAAAKDALAMASAEFKTGLTRSADLVDAENDYTNATLGVYQAIFNQRRAAFSLFKAAGKLNMEHRLN